nr:hypothetical protein GCM10025732_25610 [Glycomyces mayteni]
MEPAEAGRLQVRVAEGPEAADAGDVVGARACGEDLGSEAGAEQAGGDESAEDQHVRVVLQARFEFGAEAQGQCGVGDGGLLLGGERLRLGLVAFASGPEVPVDGGERFEVGEVGRGAGAREGAAVAAQEGGHGCGFDPGGDVVEERAGAEPRPS